MKAYCRTWEDGGWDRERRIAGRGKVVDKTGERHIAGRGKMVYETGKGVLQDVGGWQTRLEKGVMQDMGKWCMGLGKTVLQDVGRCGTRLGKGESRRNIITDSWTARLEWLVCRHTKRPRSLRDLSDERSEGGPINGRGSRPRDESFRETDRQTRGKCRCL